MKLSEVLGDLFEEERLHQSVEGIQKHLRESPQLALVAGSGWGEIRHSLKDQKRIPLQEIPHFPLPQVSGHGAELILGRMGGRSLILLSGRKHLYEGEGLAVVLYPIEIFKRLGVSIIGLTNAAGAAQLYLNIGDLLAIRDHFDSTWHVYTAPLTRLVEHPISPVYDPELLRLLTEVAKRELLPLRTGVYGFTLGPFYESPAEVRLLSRWGCDALGMSTVPEALYARMRGLRVFALSGLTNMGTGLTPMAHSHETVKEQAALLAPRAVRLLEGFVAALP